jgi:transcriptional regulator with GAF, ATPase, and Fis domain
MITRVAKPALLGVSQRFQDTLRQIHRAAESDSTVLVSGESGTGKELVARTIHELSPRQRGPFVPVDCAAMSDGLFDSEVFGHRRGAFTGAEADRPGKIARADGGTLFLDGIDCLDRDCQSRLLRVIQEKEVLPLGQNRSRRVDFRLVTSVSEDFDGHRASGEFREDLYFRINVIHLRLPPLRDRPEDIPYLAQRFARDLSARFDKPISRIDARALDTLHRYRWPGNVRELCSVIECAVASARGEVVFESDLPVHVRVQALKGDAAGASGKTAAAAPPAGDDTVAAAGDAGVRDRAKRSFAEQVEDFQRRLLLGALGRHEWNYRDAGEELGLVHHQVKYLCAKLGIRRSRFSTWTIE